MSVSVIFEVILQVGNAKKLSGSSDAPPTRAPSTFGQAMYSTFSGFHWKNYIEYVLYQRNSLTKVKVAVQRHENLTHFCASSCEADLPVPIAQIGSYAIELLEGTCSAVNPAR